MRHSQIAITNIFGVSPKIESNNVSLAGIRSVDEKERDNVHQSGVHLFTMRDIDEPGLGPVIEDAIKAASTGPAAFHASLDMDAVDPQDAPGVGTYREAHLAMEVVEVNPVVDEVNRAAMLSAMGKRIL